MLFNVITKRRTGVFPKEARYGHRHRFHRWALSLPFIVFAATYFMPWNPIYPGIVAMALGSVAAVLCRPDLKRATLIGGALFLAYYLVFLVGLEWTAPGYIERVWNLAALSGWTVLGFPAEEFLFAASFGMYWAGVYEHFTWRRARAVVPAIGEGARP